MRYTVIISGTYFMKHPKNSHEKEAFAALLKHDRSQIEQKKLKAFKAGLLKELALINAAHPTSKPIGSTWLKTYKVDEHPDHTLNLGIGSSYKFILYATRKEVFE